MKITRYKESLQYNLEATARVLQEAISVRFKELDFGLSYDEFIILDEIFHNPGILQIELAKRILKGRAYTGKFLVELEKKGYVERKTAIKGKKQVVIPVYITQNGKKVHKTAVKTIKDFMTFMPSIEDNNIDKLIEFLQLLKENVENKYNVKFL